jgi:hypothetical protein
VGQVLAATMLVAVLPVVVVWWLRNSGTLTSAIPGMAIGVGLSLGVAQIGRLYWQTRPGSQHLPFSELMAWGYLHRLHSERRLASARALLGPMSGAQRHVEGGLSAERQAKLLEQLAAAMDARDPSTHGHSRRVARYAWRVATRMGLPREEVARIRTAGAIHDIGKIKTPRSILRKQGPLTGTEYEIIKLHAGDGADLAEVLHDEKLTAIVRHHHERLDGSGYPDRLAGEAIPLGARILSVADTFDSITANRPYRPARPHKEALDILRNEAGTQLDPAVVKAFCGYYSGRRPLALWASLASLPQRAIAQLGSSVAGVAAAAKVVVVSALVGSLAVGTASLARPARGHGPSRVHLVAPVSAAPAIQPSGAGTAAPGDRGARAIAVPHGPQHPHGSRRGALRSTQPGGSSAAPTSSSGSAPAGAGGSSGGSASGASPSVAGGGGSAGGGKATGEGGGSQGGGSQGAAKPKAKAKKAARPKAPAKGAPKATRNPKAKANRKAPASPKAAKARARASPKARPGARRKPRWSAQPKPNPKAKARARARAKARPRWARRGGAGALGLRAGFAQDRRGARERRCNVRTRVYGRFSVPSPS